MPTKIVTFEGEARSGKGTSVRAVREALTEAGANVAFIDQGQKFRAFAKLGLDHSVNLSNTEDVDDFIGDDAIRQEMLDLLVQASKMEQSDLDALLYTQEIGSASAQIGGRSQAQEMIVGLLYDQVERLTSGESPDVILVDGRDVADKGRIMHQRQMAQFVLGFYFRCDTATAARRTEGIFVEVDKMSRKERLELLKAITRISDRNRQDALREVYPMREPANAYPLHTSEFKVEDDDYVASAARAALESGIVSIDTSYTRSVKEMTDPVVALTLRALELSS